MEFLFPHRERKKYIGQPLTEAVYAAIEEKFRIPQFVAQRCFNNLEALGEFFDPASPNGEAEAAK